MFFYKMFNYHLYVRGKKMMNNKIKYNIPPIVVSGSIFTAVKSGE